MHGSVATPYKCCEVAAAMQAPCMHRNSGSIPEKSCLRLRQAYSVVLIWIFHHNTVMILIIIRWTVTI
jgi:hypothetical protein